MSSANPKVSWLISVRNGMPYLRETLQSIRAQTFRNFEVLIWVVDSSDHSEGEARSWIPSKLPGRVFTSGPLGIGPTRARLVEMAQGEYCACIDADDINLPERLTKQVSFLEANPDTAMVFTKMHIIDAHGFSNGAIWGMHMSSFDDVLHSLLSGNHIGHSSVLFRRSAVLDAGNYDKLKPFLEDYDLWLRLATRHRIMSFDECLVKHRIYAQSHTQLLEPGLHSTQADKLFSVRASALFGLKPAAAYRLRTRQQFFALPYAITIARHLAKIHGGSVAKRFRTVSFIEGIHQLRRYHDFGTRLALDLIDPRPRTLVRSLMEISGKMLRAVLELPKRILQLK